jgi:hypothetical protein
MDNPAIPPVAILLGTKKPTIPIAKKALPKKIKI